MHPALANEFLLEQLASLDVSFLERHQATLITLDRPGDFIVVTHRPAGDLAHIRFDATDFDLDPPSVYLCDAHGRPLPIDRCPPNVRMLLYPHSNPDITRPFICVRGTYEYHAHSSHITDTWDAWRNTITLRDIVDRVLIRVRGVEP